MAVIKSGKRAIKFKTIRLHNQIQSLYSLTAITFLNTAPFYVTDHMISYIDAQLSANRVW